jgi:hypothetical protein
VLLRIAQRSCGLAFRFGEIPLTQIALRHDKGPVDRHEQVAVSDADAGYPLLNLQRLLRPGVRKMAVAEDVAHQPSTQISPQGTSRSSGSTMAILRAILSAKASQIARTTAA